MAHRVLLVDDHHMVRQGLAELVRGHSGFLVHGEARAANEAFHLVMESTPDLVIADLVLGQGPDGIHLTKAIKAEHPRLPVLMLSGRDEALFAERAILAGASGYLMKDEAAEVLFSAMEAVLGGGMWVSPALAERLLPASIVGRIPPLSALDEEHLPLLRELRAGNRTVLGLSRALALGPERVERALDRLGADLSLPSRVSIYLYLHRH